MWYTRSMFEIDVKQLLNQFKRSGDRVGDIDLSVIIVADESVGLMLHKSILSVMVAFGELGARCKCELVLGIEKGDAILKEYLSRYADLNNVIVCEEKYDTVGKMRNLAIRKAHGKYVALMNGGDLISAGYLAEAMRMLEGNSNIVVGPGAVLDFGIYYPNMLHLTGTDVSVSEQTLEILDGINRGMSVVGSRQLLLDNPYNEEMMIRDSVDLLFNAQIISNGAELKSMRQSMLFRRCEMDGYCDIGKIKQEIMARVELLGLANIKKLGGEMAGSDEYDDKISVVKGNKIYKRIRENRVVSRMVAPIANYRMRRRNNSLRSSVKLPEYVLECWRDINMIETQLFPHEWTLKELIIAEENGKIGRAYCDLMKEVEGADYIFIVPWLIRGGGDKVIINYANALYELHPDWNMVVIATEPSKESVWRDKLPKSATFIEFGKKTNGWSERDRDRLMSLIISQAGQGRIHIVNSMFGYLWALRHKDWIRKNCKLNISLFNAEPNPGDGIFAYDDPYLRDLLDVVRRVFTDNWTMIDRMVEMDGFEKTKKFQAHYQPLTNMKMRIPKRDFVERGKLRVLWAGRMVPVKIPGIVSQIGEKLDAKKYQIDMYGEMRDEDMGKFDYAENVRYMGRFDGFDSLPVDKYDVLLYTSMSDGVPNIILEAIAAGLPVIASDDGGVGEVIKDKKTGILIKDIQNPDAYTKRIQEITDMGVLSLYVENAQKLIKKRHTWKAFVQEVERDLVD